MRTLLVALALGTAAAGCRSPFGTGVETGPPEDPARVGSGVHAWPLYESVYEGAEHRDDVLWPAWSRRVDAATGALRRLDVLYPLVLREVYDDGSRFGIRPLFDVETRDRTDGRVEDVDLLFPLVKWRGSPERSLLRVYPVFSHERTDAYEETNVLPVWWRRTGGTREHHFVWPAWGWQRDGTWERTWILPPLFAHGGDPEKGSREWDALWPLVHRRVRGDDWRFRALPLFSGAHEGDERHTVIPPLWWDFQDADSSFRMLFPVYGRQRGPDEERTIVGGPLWISSRDGDVRATDVLFPIFRRAEDEAGWDLRAFPVLWLERRGERALTHVWPLYGRRDRPGRVEHYVAWPLVTYERIGEGWSLEAISVLAEFGSRGDRSWGRVFPLFRYDVREESAGGEILLHLARWKSAGDTGEFRVLWRLVDSGRTKERRHFALNPLFRWEANERGDRHWSVLLGLVARTTDAEGPHWRLLWFL